MKNSLKGNTGYKIFYIFIIAVLVAFCLSTIIPFILAIMVSITDEKTIIMEGFKFIPSKFSLLAYKMVFGENWVFNAYKVTVAVTAIGTFLCIIFSAMAGYVMSIAKVKYRNVIALFLFVTMVFNAGLVPWYLLITRYLHLKNSLAGLILPILINPFWIFLLRNYFKTIPASLAESAEIDGAGPVYTFFRIILPLSKPIIATVALFASLNYWNDYILALWLIDKQNLYPLQYMLYKVQSLVAYLSQHGGGSIGGSVLVPTDSSQMAIFAIALGPIVLVYPFVQKYFVKGIMIGAVKG